MVASEKCAEGFAFHCYCTIEDPFCSRENRLTYRACIHTGATGSGSGSTGSSSGTIQSASGTSLSASGTTGSSSGTTGSASGTTGSSSGTTGSASSLAPSQEPPIHLQWLCTRVSTSYPNVPYVT